MNFLRFLFGKRRQDEDQAVRPGVDAPNPLSPESWAKLDWDDRETYLSDELHQIRRVCENAGIQVFDERREVELRGMFRQRPISVTCNYAGASDVMVRFINRRGLLSLTRATMPERDFESPASPDSSEPEVSPGVVLVTTDDEREQHLALWRVLPGSLRERLAALTRECTDGIRIGPQEVECTLAVGPARGEAIAPTVLQTLELFVEVADLFVQGDEPVAPKVYASGVAVPTKQELCPSCKVNYYVEIDDPRCPSCGAER